MTSLVLPADRLSAASLLARDPQGGVTARFAERRVAYAYSTRVAIRAACDALGLKPGDEVLVPAYNCGSEIDPLRHAGLVPVLYPVGATTEVDPSRIEPLVTSRTKALYLTHYFGFAQPATAKLRAFCDRHGIALMEDCALALLSEGQAEVGRTGDVAFFCFYKYFPVNAGGAIVVNHDKVPVPTFAKAPPLRPAVKLLLQAAMAGLLGPRGLAALKALRRRLRPARGPAPALAGNGLPDMPADYYFDPSLIGTRISALAARPLGAFDVAEHAALRRRNYRAYLDLLTGCEGVTPLFATLPDGVCPLNMPVLIDDRDRIAAQMVAEGIAVTPWWAGYHRDVDFTPFPEERHLKDHILALPLYAGLQPRHLQRIVARLTELIAQPS